MNLLNTKLKTEQKGIAAVEFALFLPFIIVLWIGIVELTEWQLSSRKVTIATLSAADLISQQIEVNNDRLNDYVAAIKEIMKPSLVESELGVFLASMSLDVNGNPQIDWKQDSNSSNGDTIPVEVATLLTETNSVIVAIVNYRHKRRFAYNIPGIPDTVLIVEKAFSLPRRVQKIVRVN
jgi:Flp pilus assembly protein TadG